MVDVEMPAVEHMTTSNNLHAAAPPAPVAKGIEELLTDPDLSPDPPPEELDAEPAAAPAPAGLGPEPALVRAWPTDSVDADMSIPGVARLRGGAKVAAVAVGAAAIFAIIAGFIGMRARQERQAEERRAAAAAVAGNGPTAENPSPTVAIPPPSAEPSHREEEAAPEVPPTTTATAEPVAVERTAPEPGTRSAAASTPPSVAPDPLPSLPGPSQTPASAAPSPGEQPLDTPRIAAGSSLAMLANRALANGATGRAMDLARQAVSANPGDANAWLILGAASQASGNAVAAREAYQNCITQARGPNVNDCRALAGH
jgi:hypothetical protein